MLDSLAEDMLKQLIEGSRLWQWQLDIVFTDTAT